VPQSVAISSEPDPKIRLPIYSMQTLENLA
jgi:hypothetical protein